MKIKVEVDRYELIDSGVFYLYEKDAKTSFHITAEDGFSFHIVLKFTSDNSKSEHALKRMVDEKTNTITFECINFNGQLGTGTINPLDIATVGGKTLCFHFWSYLPTGTTRKIEYTIFLSKTVEEDEE